MNYAYRRGTAIAIFMIVLGAELSAAMVFVPSMDVADMSFHDFMLVSMGYAFIPLLVVLVVAAIALAALVLIAYLAARLFLRLVEAS